MSINSMSCIQSIAIKNSKASPLTEIILTNPYNPGPHNPNAYFFAQSAIVRNSANNQITAFSCTITNQTGNYTFANGVYSFSSEIVAANRIIVSFIIFIIIIHTKLFAIVR